MAKRYIRINYQNSPSTATPLNEVNLNKMDKGIKDCDDAIGDLVLLKTTAKADLVAAINEQNDNFAGKMAVIDKNVIVSTANTDIEDTVNYPAGFNTNNCRSIVSLQGASSTNLFSINKLQCAASSDSITIRINATTTQTYLLVIFLVKIA